MYKPLRKVEGKFFGRALHMRCNYYKMNGHLTECCVAFMKYLEELVQQGYLLKFVDHIGGVPGLRKEEK